MVHTVCAQLNWGCQEMCVGKCVPGNLGQTKYVRQCVSGNVCQIMCVKEWISVRQCVRECVPEIVCQAMQCVSDNV